MNQSIITGLGTPQLSRIIEEGESHSRKTQQGSVFNFTHHKQCNKREQEEELDGIEQEIKEIGKRLEDLHLEMKRMQDKYSEQYLQKEHIRNNLRKDLIDLDYKHKTIFAKKIKENNGNSIIHQFYENKPQYNSPNKNNDKNTKQKNKESTQQKAIKYTSPLQTYKSTEKKSKSKQNELQQSERRLRIAAIESQLNQEKLHRSRIEKLTKELVYLRTAYSYPYSLSDYYSEYYYPSYSPLYSSWWLY